MSTVVLEQDDVDILNQWATDFGVLLANAEVAVEKTAAEAATPAARRAAEELLGTIKALSSFVGFVAAAANTYNEIETESLPWATLEASARGAGAVGVASAGVAIIGAGITLGGGVLPALVLTGAVIVVYGAPVVDDLIAILFDEMRTRGILWLGDDFREFANRYEYIAGTDAADTITLDPNRQMIADVAGLDGADTITGSGIRDYIYGNGGDDIIEGGDGGDYLYGRGIPDGQTGGFNEADADVMWLSVCGTPWVAIYQGVRHTVPGRIGFGQGACGGETWWSIDRKSVPRPCLTRKCEAAA